LRLQPEPRGTSHSSDKRTVICLWDDVIWLPLRLLLLMLHVMLL
jgi:hypothetical protein